MRSRIGRGNVKGELSGPSSLLKRAFRARPICDQREGSHAATSDMRRGFFYGLTFGCRFGIVCISLHQSDAYVKQCDAIVMQAASIDPTESEPTHGKTQRDYAD